MKNFIELVVKTSLEDESNSTECVITGSYQVNFKELGSAITAMHKAIAFLLKQAKKEQ